MVYFLNFEPISGISVAVSSNKPDKLKLLHNRLRHIGDKGLQPLKSKGVYLDEQCVLGKQDFLCCLEYIYLVLHLNADF